MQLQLQRTAPAWSHEAHLFGRNLHRSFWKFRFQFLDKTPKLQCFKIIHFLIMICYPQPTGHDIPKDNHGLKYPKWYRIGCHPSTAQFFQAHGTWTFPTIKVGSSACLFHFGCCPRKRLPTLSHAITSRTSCSLTAMASLESGRSSSSNNSSTGSPNATRDSHQTRRTWKPSAAKERPGNPSVSMGRLAV